MAITEKQALIKRLNKLHVRLLDYQGYFVNYCNSALSRETYSDMMRLRTELERESGALGPIISQLTGKSEISIVIAKTEYTRDMWYLALLSPAELRTITTRERTFKAINFCILAVNQAIGALEEGAELSMNPKYANNKVFIIHGRDDGAKQTVARFIDNLDLTPIILHEQPDEGSTYIFEKIEANSNVGYAVALLTPDDKGNLEPMRKLNKRARQNVILEMGYFMGKLGRKRVSALYWDDVERPTDYEGVLYIPYDNPGAWRLTLGKALKAAGLAVDLNKIK